MTPIPAGWKLIPIEPTPEMLEAARRAPLPAVMMDSRSATEDLQHKAAYAAMLAAAPSPTSVAPGDAQDEQPKRNGCGSVSFKLSDGSAVSCDWSTHEWELSIPATRHERDIAFKELLQEIGRLRASVAAPAAGDALEERQDWMACESRGPWVTNGLKAYAQELRDKERRCRTAFNKDFMGVPSRYVADAYAEAAAVFEAKLAALAAQVPQQGEA